MGFLREFFGLGGYRRTPEGFFSPAHLILVASLTVLMIALAVFFGRRHRGADEKRVRRFLLVCAIVIDSLELIKAVTYCATDENPAFRALYFLPLFLCTMQMIVIPVAAFAKGRVQEACLDFIFLFGLLGAMLGMWAGANVYGSFPILSLDCIVSAVTHAGIGLVSLYIPIAGLSRLKLKNAPITVTILLIFCALAYGVNCLIAALGDGTPYNYMFLMGGDGTPYDLVYNFVGGSPVFYPLSVISLFLLFMAAFYAVFHAITKKQDA